MHLVGSFGYSASERVSGFDVSAGAFAVAWSGAVSGGKRSNGYVCSSTMYLVSTLVGFSSDSASECVGGVDVSAGLTVFIAAWSSCFHSSWLLR